MGCGGILENMLSIDKYNIVEKGCQSIDLCDMGNDSAKNKNNLQKVYAKFNVTVYLFVTIKGTEYGCVYGNGGNALFGYLRLKVPEVKIKDYALYRGVYCGLCKTMRRCTGRCSVLALRYDAVFCVLLQMALRHETPILGTGRCLLHPFRRRPILQSTPSLTVGARMNAALAAYKCDDFAKDATGFSRSIAWMGRLGGVYLRRKGKLPDEWRILCEENLMHLHRLEREHSPSPDAVAECFGKLLAGLFAYDLPDASARIAHTIGDRMGRFIYLLDAVDDAKKDAKSGNYNPFVCAGVDVFRNEIVRTALLSELAEAEKAYALLTDVHPQLRALLDNQFYLAFPDTVDRILGFAPTTETRDMPRTLSP